MTPNVLRTLRIIAERRKAITHCSDKTKIIYRTKSLLENDFTDKIAFPNVLYPSSCVFSLGQGHMLNFHKNSKSAEKNFKDKKQCELSESRADKISSKQKRTE